MLNVPDITDLEVHFSTGKFTPKVEDIPQIFFNRGNPWCKLFSRIFFEGAEVKEFVPKPGVDLTKNLRFFRHCATTWGTKHEHKEAACAWILSETFISPVPVVEAPAAK